MIFISKTKNSARKCQRWVKLWGKKNFTIAKCKQVHIYLFETFLEEHLDPIPATGTSLDKLRAQKRSEECLSG